MISEEASLLTIGAKLTPLCMTAKYTLGDFFENPIHGSPSIGMGLYPTGNGWVFTSDKSLKYFEA